VTSPRHGGHLHKVLRRVFKALIRVVAYFVFTLRLPMRLLSVDRSIRILMYHSVSNLPEETWDDYDNVPVKQFEQQMEYLQRRYKVMSLSDMVRLQEQQQRPEPWSIIISFDDGYRNQFLYAYPISKADGRLFCRY
jgi:hypothetical protein